MGTLQEDSNAIGEAMRDLENEIDDTDDPVLMEKAQVLHQLLSQGCVDHLVPLGVDWHETAGDHSAARGGGTDKPKPAPTGG